MASLVPSVVVQIVLIQLQIIESNGGRIDGSVAVSQFDYEAGKLKQTTKAVSGIRRDGQFSLLAHHEEWGASDAAFAMEAKGNSLFLKLPTMGKSWN